MTFTPTPIARPGSDKLAMPGIRPLLGIAAMLLLAACGSGEQTPAPGKTEGTTTAADTTGQGQPSGAEQDRSAEAVAAIRKQAAQLAGGSLKPVPDAASGSANVLTQAAVSAARVSPESRASGLDCSTRVKYGNEWATRLPPELPVYARATVQEAAGVDGQGCALQVASFTTPVDIEDVIGFYYTKATAAGYGAEYKVDGGDHVLGGHKGGRAYVVYASKLDSGLIGVDLVSSGK